MKLKHYNADGTQFQEKEFLEFPEFEDEKGKVALSFVIKMSQAAMRQGNACTKTRGEVSGGGKKPWRQKGTGRARQGSNRSPIWSGGGTVFGPKPRSYDGKINRQVRRLALARAFFECVSREQACVMEHFSVLQPKTRELVPILSRVAPEGRVLLVDAEFSDDFVLAGRNLQRVSMVDAVTVNVLDMVSSDFCILTERAAAILSKRMMWKAVS
jgi:large subunit ribosomal protein L4